MGHLAGIDPSDPGVHSCQHHHTEDTMKFFVYPQLLWLLLGVPLLIMLYLLACLRRRRAVNTLVSPSLLPLLSPNLDAARRHTRFFLFLFACILIVIALAFFHTLCTSITYFHLCS
ncbi:MAG: hypothetical protein D6820_11520, partial [Lentisphaerae bacterium]